MLQAGFRVDRWEVESVLGQGGMATVYAVRHVVLGTRQALKVLSVHNAALAERLLREGRLQGGVRHPNVVAVMDFVEVAGAPGLVLELVEGPSLERYLGRGRPPADVVDAIGRGLIAGIDAAHRQGLVHRDLKPANVLLAAGDDALVPKITDFGLVKALGEAGGGTLPGALLGTPGYMAPEQLRDPSRVDARADLFALGAMLYELVTGRPPFSGQDPIALYERMCDRRYVPVRELVPDAAEGVVSAIEAALEPDPRARVADAATLRELWTGERYYERPTVPSASGELEVSAAATWALDGLPPSALGLPRYGRELVGRERELADVNAALARPGLVALVGPGGVGKTRLAAEVAGAWGETGSAVVWVDLQEALDERDLARTVAWALDVRDDPRPDAVARALQSRGEVLVVLDNLEQLLTADSVAPRLIAGWADAARRGRMLVTSRLPVGVRGERVVRLEPLAVPETDEELAGSPVLALFRGASPDERSLGSELGLIRQVLVLLDGLPLAIELAAARLEVLELHELHARLTRDLGVLASPGDPSRHGALERTIEWSWSLLGPTERAALVQASVFRGGFGLDAAEAVLRVPGGVLDALHGLVRRSLLVRDRGRIRMLESIRAFAGSRLGDDTSAIGRHAAFYGAAARMWCDRKVTALSQHIDDVAREAANLEVVVRRAAGDPALVDDALWCGTALAFLADLRGPVDSRIALADTVLALPSGPDRPRVQIQRLRARWRRRRGDIEGARADLVEARALAEAGGHADLVTRLVANEADLLMQIGDVEAAWTAYEQALGGADAHGMDDIAVVALAGMALLARDVGRTAEEQDVLAAAAIRRASRLGDPGTELQAQKSVGTAFLERNAFAEADARFERGILLAEQLGDQRSVAVMTGQRGLIAEALGDLDVAERRFRRVVDWMRQQGDPTFVAYYEGFLGRVLLRRGAWVEGGRLLEGAIRALGAASDPKFAELFGHLVALAQAREGRLEDVERWAAAVAADPRSSVDPLALLALTNARVSAMAGDRVAAIAHADEAERRMMADLAVDSGGALLFRAVLDELRDAVAGWWFAADGSWMEPPGGSRVDLSRHAANARILGHLVEQRLTAPGRASDVEALATAGWPGERIVSTAAANRVRVALSALRREGLDPLLQRARDGWLLDPQVRVRVVTPIG